MERRTMYFDQNWITFSEVDLARLCDLIGPAVGEKHTVNIKSTLAEQRSLPFYDSVHLIRVKDPAWEPKNLFIYFLAYKTDLIWLNGTLSPLHQLNAKGVLFLTDSNVLEYLRFFCFFVRGKEGPFMIVEDISDTYLPKKVDATTLNVFKNTVRPAYNEVRDSDGNWNCDAVIYYSNAIFLTNYIVEPDGKVHMLSDEPIAANLPVKIDVPIA